MLVFFAFATATRTMCSVTTLLFPPIHDGGVVHTIVSRQGCTKMTMALRRVLFRDGLRAAVGRSSGWRIVRPHRWLSEQRRVRHKPPFRVYLIAGEASGDAIGSKLIHASNAAYLCDSGR